MRFCIGKTKGRVIGIYAYGGGQVLGWGFSGVEGDMYVSCGFKNLEGSGVVEF